MTEKGNEISCEEGHQPIQKKRRQKGYQPGQGTERRGYQPQDNANTVQSIVKNPPSGGTGVTRPPAQTEKK
jgi:hypothetical protein